jgi:hypothetical protein
MGTHGVFAGQDLIELESCQCIDQVHSLFIGTNVGRWS